MLARLLCRPTTLGLGRTSARALRANTASPMLRKGNEIWVAPHMLPGTAEVTCPRPRGDGAGCHAYPCQAELPRIHADNCSAPSQVDFQDCGAVAIPTQWMVACTVCPQPTQIGSYFRVLHQRSSGSEPCIVSVIRALRSALHTL